MFDEKSRYYPIETAEYQTPDGQVIPYKRRRFVPPASDADTLVEVTVTEGERLDQITAQQLGDPEQFWRICDANNAMNPFDLTYEPGQTLRVPVPRFTI